MRRALTLLAVLALGPLAAAPAAAETYGGVEFPGGAGSFADVVSSFDPVVVNGEPAEVHRNAEAALGVPDHISGAVGDFVSLGDGGSITIQFVDNSLTGSGDNSFDLWVFEIGPQVEETFVWVSGDGIVWTAVGLVAGGTAGVDLDAYGFKTTDRLSFVRLQDHPDKDGQTGASVGADIDAIGAISTNLAPRPLDDAYSIAAYTTLSVAAPGVVANDSDPEDDAVTAILDVGTVRGVVQLQPDGGFSYRPQPGYVGSDNFTYRLRDSFGNESGPATVSIEVTGCGEDGLQILEDRPGDGLASKAVHEVIEPAALGFDEELAALVHELNCDIVVPVENTIDEATG